jgi:hypothetical protein
VMDDLYKRFLIFTFSRGLGKNSQFGIRSATTNRSWLMNELR